MGIALQAVNLSI